MENVGKYSNRRKLDTKVFTMFIILKNMETTGGDYGANIGTRERAKNGLVGTPIYCKHFRAVSKGFPLKKPYSMNIL